MRLNILQISDGYGYLPDKGPIEKVLFNISKEMAKMGNDVTILERNYPNAKKVEFIDGVRVVRLDRRRCTSYDLFNLSSPSSLIPLTVDGLSFMFEAVNYLDKNGKFDVIHAHLPFSSLAIVMLRRDLRKRFFYTFHGNDYRIPLTSNSTSSQLLLKLLSPDLLLMKRVNKVIMLNAKIKQDVVSEGLLGEESVEVISNGATVEEYDDLPKVSGHPGAKNVTVLFVGLIVKRKGVGYLVKAADIIVNRLKYSNVEFLIVGKALAKGADSVFYQRMISLTEEFRLQKNVKFMGFVSAEELRKQYIESDIFVLPSISEAFALVLLEAMMFGKPVIATDVGATSTMIKDGWNGFLVRPMDFEQLAEKIRYFIDNPNEKARMGRNSRRLVEKEFTWDKIAEKYLQVYKNKLF